MKTKTKEPNMSSYTKGKWIRVKQLIHSEKGQIIADMSFDNPIQRPIGGYERDCNAKLIASAPELLEACKAVKKFFLNDLNMQNSKIEQQIHELEVKLKVVINKAEGK